MTPAQLRAYACVARLGSVKAAAAELEIGESAVSMHVAQLRKSLGDPLFSRTGSGLAFTPGGLRLASRAVEILGLQDQTVQEVSEAADGRRVLRLGAASLFAEHAAPGLIDAFTKRADDLEVELSVHPPDRFTELLAGRAIDVAIGPQVTGSSDVLAHRPLLAYDIQLVAAPTHRLAGRRVRLEELRSVTWFLGPAAIGRIGVIPTMLARLKVPEQNQRIFQSEAAALTETKRADGISPAVAFAIAADVDAGLLVPIPAGQMRGMWHASTLKHNDMSSVAELLRFMTTPRATQAMLRGAGVAVDHFRPAVHVTLWN